MTTLKDSKLIDSRFKSDVPHLIVIGGTSGIGLALALHHQQLGWQVSVVGHSDEKIAHINSQYLDIKTYHCDLTDSVQTQKLLDKFSDISFHRLGAV